MNDHVHPRRLFEIAQKQIVLEQPEWPHIQGCALCSERLEDFVRQICRQRQAIVRRRPADTPEETPLDGQSAASAVSRSAA